MTAEAWEQKHLIEWSEWMQVRFPELRLLFHIPNGGKRSEVEAAHLKMQGVKRGVPDLFLPVARQGYHGLFIEMKTAKGVVSPFQREWLNDLADQGYYATVCRGADEAKKVIEAYLK